MSERTSRRPMGDYRDFASVFAAARSDHLFRAVGGLYGEDGLLGERWPLMLERLREAGATNLNLGRLLEGHANAVQLVRLYGDRAQRAGLEEALENDEILGVWGADGAPPAAAEDADGTTILRGAKRYASGLGMVGHAVVPIAGEGGVLQLYLVPVGDPARQDLSAWTVSGMRSSASGRYSLEGIAVEPHMRLGGPGVYKTEPFFEGGIWRCAAVHLGGVETIVALTARHLDATGRLDHPLQTERLGRAILAARTARLWVEDAGRRIEAPQPGDPVGHAVAVASYTRLQVEACALQSMEIARRAVGLSSFETDHPLDMAIADLSVYLRQANPDALLLHKCRAMAEDYLQ